MKESDPKGPDETGVTSSAAGSPNRQAGAASMVIQSASAHRRCDHGWCDRKGSGLDLDVFWGVMGPDEGAFAASRRSMLAHLPGLPAVPPTMSTFRPSSSTEASCFDGEVTYGIASRGSANGGRGAIGRSRVRSGYQVATIHYLFHPLTGMVLPI
jgi:hypothetical protein